LKSVGQLELVVKRLLLLTDIPPCTNLTAGLVLDQLCQFLSPSSIACFVVLNPHLQPVVSEVARKIAIEVAAKPNELGMQRQKIPYLRAPLAWAIEGVHRWYDVPKILRKAESFARAQQVDAIWATLQGQTMIRMALPLAKRLRVPLYTQVWDPPSWWLTAHGVGRSHARATLRQFETTLRACSACATASEAMANEYAERYEIRCVPVIASHDEGVMAQPSSSLSIPGEVTIAMAGQFYAEQEWCNLIETLRSKQWQVDCRKVRIQILGRDQPLTGLGLPQVEFLGWKSQREAIEILSRADILYCPYPFAGEMEEVSRLSFPSKLVLYLACGRPVLFHGPGWSSPGRYLAARGAGVLCTELSPSSIYDALWKLVADPVLYQSVILNGRAAFLQDFTLKTMRNSFAEFLGLSGESLNQLLPRPSQSLAY
jgi:glycosyltransferase involved in cell wall biosynthesis